MSKLKTRDEIKDEHKWNLKTIYKTDFEFYNELDSIKQSIDDFPLLKDDMMKSANNLYRLIKEEEKISLIIMKLYMYAHLNKDSDTSNTTYQKMYGNIMNLYNEFSKNSSFIVPEMLKKDYDTIEKFYIDEPKLKEYEFNLINIYRQKDHYLSAEEEKIISSLSDSLDVPEKLYDIFTNSELTFGNILDENNKEVELTDSNFSIYIKSKDRRVRIDAFNTLYNGYSKYKDTISLMLSSCIKNNNTTAKIRKFTSSFEEALFDDNIDKKVYENLVEVIENNIKPLNDYMKLKKEILGVDELHMYDLYVPLLEEKYIKKYTFEEAKELTLKVVNVLGEDYVNNFKKAFDEKWIDIYPNKGKASGAYSSGSYLTNPFILLNYQDTLYDVSTLIHEMGHSMHSYYSRNNNPYQYSNYKIFVAEVASIVNELLLSYYLLDNSNDDKEKLVVLNNLMELYRTTIYRQTMFASFEKELYDRDLNGTVLTSDVINDIYLDLNKKYYGENVVCDDLIKYEWEKVPHFYYDFYVYQYSTGLSCATEIVKNILENKENAKENYLEFLKTGGRDYPINELKVAGVDITDKSVILNSVNTFEKIVKDFNEIYRKVYKK